MIFSRIDCVAGLGWAKLAVSGLVDFSCNAHCRNVRCQLATTWYYVWTPEVKNSKGPISHNILLFVMEWLNIDQNEWPLQLSLHWRYWMESALGHRDLLPAQKVQAIRSWELETNWSELEMSGWILAWRGSKLQSFIPSERDMKFSLWVMKDIVKSLEKG